MSEPTNWLSLAKAAYDTSTTYFDASIRTQIDADIRQFNGLHPKGSKYLNEAYRSRAKFFRPKTRAAIRKNEAIHSEALFSTTDVVTFTAENPSNPMQQASADVMKYLMQYRLTKSIPWFLIAQGAYQDAQTTGMVISKQYWEFREKGRKKIDRPCIELIPIENFRFDPNAKWYDPVGSSPYLIHLIPMYVKDVRARATVPDIRTGQPKWKEFTGEQMKVACQAYSNSTKLEREPGRTDANTQPSEINDFTIVWVHENIIEQDGQDYVYYTLGTVHILSDPKPLDTVYWTGERPFVVGQCIIETHKNYPSGLPRLTSNTQGEINEIANQRIDNVKFAMNKRYFAKRSGQVDLRSLTRNAVSAVTLMNDPEKDVKIVETQDVTSSSYQEQDRLNGDFDDLAGTFSGSSIASNRKLNETVGGMQMLTADKNQMAAYQLKTHVETWVEPVLRQLVKLEQEYETDEVILALAGQKAQLLEKFGIDTLTDELLLQELTLTVNVGMGATNPQERVNNLLLGINAVKQVLEGGLIERYGGKPGELIKEIMSAVGFKDGGRFFPGIDTQDPTVQALVQQVQELTSALEAKHPPELIAAQVKKLMADTEKSLADRVRIGVEAAFSAMQAGQVIAATPQVAPVADEIMKGASYTSPAAGVDPNFPQAAGADGITLNAIKNKRSGVEYTPPGATTVRPANPGIGEQQGIETLRQDSVPA
jgi:hypothetical protein